MPSPRNRAHAAASRPRPTLPNGSTRPGALAYYAELKNRRGTAGRAWLLHSLAPQGGARLLSRTEALGATGRSTPRPGPDSSSAGTPMSFLMGFQCSRCSPTLILLAGAHGIRASCDSDKGRVHLAKAEGEGSNSFSRSVGSRMWTALRKGAVAKRRGRMKNNKLNPGRNDPCPCGSGKKYKKCHLHAEAPAEETDTEVPDWLYAATVDGRGRINQASLKHVDASRGLVAYSDESGHTGVDLFTQDQPDFFTGTLLTASELDGERDSLGVVLEQHGLKELHGNEIGLRRLAVIAPFVQKLIALHDCRFVFTRTEKRHFAKLKFIYTVLDSGNNKAVTNAHAFFRPLHLPLAAALEQALGEGAGQALEDFWWGFVKNKPDLFCKSLRQVRAVLSDHPDQRLRQLLVDALDWAIEHPADVMDAPEKAAFNTPNVVALVQISHAIRIFLGNSGHTVRRFIHDRQSEIALAAKAMHEVGARFRATENPGLVFPEIAPSEAINDKIEMTAEPLVGLQLVDVALWLIKRTLNGEALHVDVQALVREIIERSMFRTMGRAQFYADYYAAMKQVANLPVTAEQLEEGQRAVKEMEESRLRRMREPLICAE